MMRPRQLPPGQFDWTVTLGKTIRDALLSAVPIALGVLIGALAGVFEPDNLTRLGVPVWAIPVLLGLFTGARNFLRVRWGWPVVIACLMLLSPAPARADGVNWAEITEGFTNPIIVIAPAYLQEAPVDGTSRVSVIITANIPGPKLGTIPCYLGGVGVDIRTLDPAFEDATNAGWSLPYLTCNPWGEQVVIQVGQASDFSNVPELGGSKSYYAGLGVSWNSPTELKAKRAARQKAKEQKALLDLQDQAQGRTASQ